MPAVSFNYWEIDDSIKKAKKRNRISLIISEI